jgi:hypothetical protein
MTPDAETVIANLRRDMAERNALEAALNMALAENKRLRKLLATLFEEGGRDLARN